MSSDTNSTTARPVSSGRAPKGGSQGKRLLRALTAAMSVAQQRVVKLYGSKIGSEKGYGSGVIVSADGQILTVSSLLLDGQLTGVAS